MESPWWGLMMGIEHERIHLETSSVLIRQLPIAMVTRPQGWRYGPLEAPEPVAKNSLVSAPAQTVTLGKPRDFPSFGWDNCYGRLETRAPAFQASEYLISNREFLAFVKDDGYEKEELWSSEGWQWCCYRQAKHPTFWICKKGCRAGCGGDLGCYSHCKIPASVTNGSAASAVGHNGYDPDVVDSPRHLVNGQNGYCNGHNVTDSNGHQGKDEGGGLEYRLRCLYDDVPLPLDWPAEVNYHEAKAFAAWKGEGFRLPTEAEYYVIRALQDVTRDDVSCDVIFRKDFKANLNLTFGSSTPVNLYPASAAGFYDSCGNVWQWTEDHFNGLPYFLTSSLYDDFSGPCFDGRHNMILGGSWISTGDEASRFARFAFRRHFFQHAGFRLARSLANADGTKPPIPARHITTPVYVLGIGEQAVQADSDVADTVPTTYNHYVLDTEDALNAQLGAEYGPATGSLTIRLAALCQGWLNSTCNRKGAALHVGCGTGSVTFKLADMFQQMVGVDYSGRFINACIRLQSGATLKYSTAAQQLADVSIEKPNRNNLVFKQMTWLPNELGVNDFVLVSLLDRVQNAKSWTVRFPEVVRQDGLLVVTSRGEQGQQEVRGLLDQKFELLAESSLPANGPVSAVWTVTAWRHKH